MIVDTSALLAILLQEEDGDLFLKQIYESNERLMSVFSYLEAAVRLDRLGQSADSLDSLIAALGIQLRDVTAAQIVLARRAYAQYGKGSGHPAQLNLGDVLVYALAIDEALPILHKGDEFTRTDAMKMHERE